jgi:hypothetical protein
MKKKNLSRYTYISVLIVSMFWTAAAGNVAAAGWNVVDTGQDKCYDEKRSQITCPAACDVHWLAAGTYDGIITVSAGNAVNSPQKVNVKLNVLSSSGGVPFGECSTPADGAVVRSSVPFTGWGLDDLGIGTI